MQIEQFVEITRDVINKPGFKGFQPTVCFPERKNIRALAGVPDSEDHELIALRWAEGLAGQGEEYLVAFRCSATEFKVVRFHEGSVEHQVHAAEA